MGGHVDCPRCNELRGRAVKMSVIKKGPPERSVDLAYECPSCDYTIPLAPFDVGKFMRGGEPQC